MKYVRPAIDQRVQVTGPVVTATAAPTSLTITPRWAPHDEAREGS